MNTCDTCKWWHPNKHKEWGGDCWNNKLATPIFGDETTDDAAWGKDDDELFQCGPKFGCIHHESKSPTAMVDATALAALEAALRLAQREEDESE